MTFENITYDAGVPQESMYDEVRSGTKNKSRQYGTLGTAYFYATQPLCLYIVSKTGVQTAGYSTGHIPRRLHFLLNVRPHAEEKRPIRSFRAGIIVPHRPRLRRACAS